RPTTHARSAPSRARTTTPRRSTGQPSTASCSAATGCRSARCASGRSRRSSISTRRGTEAFTRPGLMPRVVLDLSPEVAGALAAEQPVVALETTLVTHGLPPPEGIAVALELEEEVRAAGALPATIGVLDGKLRVGLSEEELRRLAAAAGVAKLNPGNL